MPNKSSDMSLEAAISMGEYEPEILKKIPEWNSLSLHGQLQQIKKGLDARREQLLVQWAEMDRAIDARLKPELNVAKSNIEKQLMKIESDREKYYLEYSSKY